MSRCAAPPDDQLAMGTAFAAGLVAGFILARVPRPLLLLALVPLAVLGGTLVEPQGSLREQAQGSLEGVVQLAERQAPGLLSGCPCGRRAPCPRDRTR